MLIAVRYRYHIINYSYIKCTCANVAAFVSCNPGNDMRTKTELIDNEVISKVDQDTCRRGHCQSPCRTALIDYGWLRNTHVCKAEPEVRTDSNIVWTGKNRAFKVAHLNNLYAFNRLLSTPVKN